VAGRAKAPATADDEDEEDDTARGLRMVLTVFSSVFNFFGVEVDKELSESEISAVTCPRFTPPFFSSSVCILPNCTSRFLFSRANARASSLIFICIF
jgi:hypothetical protein